MADQEMQILISAVDNMSTTVDNISRKMVGMGDTIQRTEESTSRAFTQSSGQMMIYGQAIGNTISMFTQYEMMQLRLENLADRVANAHDRLIDAQQHLIELQNSGIATTSQLVKAHEELDRATRNLEISMNNLTRAKSHAIATVIQMEVQFGYLITQIPAMITGVEGLVAVYGALDVALAASGIGIIAVVAGLLLYNNAMGATKVATDALSDTESQRIARLQQTANAQGAVNEATNKFDEITKQITKLTSGKTVEEITAHKKTLEAQETFNSASVKLEQNRSGELSRGLLGNVQFAKMMYEAAKADETRLSEHVKAQQDIRTTNAELAAINQGKLEADTLNTRLSKIDEFFNDLDNHLKTSTTLAQTLNTTLAGTPTFAGGTAFTQTGGGTMAFNTGIPTAPQPDALQNFWNYGLMGPPKQDFVMRPGQGPVAFSSNDTLVGIKDTKGVGGVNVTIGAVYGVNPRQISEALYERLRNAISI